MRKNLTVTFIIMLTVAGFGIIGAVPLSAAENSTNVEGIITSETTWTKADSPYSLTGLVGVANGVTLTIEPGVTVNLGEYSLQVGGTLIARGGSGENNITFISKTAAYGNIAFTNGSSNRQTGSTSIIENAILYSTSVSINNVSLIINNNTITGSINIDQEASPLISNNLIAGDIGVHSSSPTIDHNSIIGGINIGGDRPVISNNIIEGGGSAGIGIKTDGPFNVNIFSNVIYHCGAAGISGYSPATIEKNLVIDNKVGIESSSFRFQIQNNTIADNSLGIKIRGYGGVIIHGNNIQNNRQNSIYLEDAEDDVDATLNWWGTIETQLINLTIHDKKNEPKLGSVSFVLFLSAPVPEAPSTFYTPITQTPQDSTTPDQSSTQNTDNKSGLNMIEVALLAALIVIIGLLVVIVMLVAGRKR